MVSPFLIIDPVVLKEYHHLTPGQINTFFGYTVLPETPDATGTSLETFRELTLVAEALDRHKVAFITLKGPLLAYRLNGDVTSRYYTDLDILVELPEIDKAVGALRELGYKNTVAAWPETERMQNMLASHDNQVGFSHPDRMMIVELHWRLMATAPVSDRRLSEIVRSNLTDISVGGRSFKVLSDELEFLYLIIHGGRHYWRRLKWLVDADSFLRNRKIDWSKFEILVTDLKAERLVAIFTEVYLKWFPDGLEMLQELMHASNMKAPPGMVKYALKRISEVEEKRHDSITGIVKSLFYNFRSFPGFSYKFRVIRNYLFVKNFLGQSGVFSYLPVFYFYSVYKLCLNRLRR